MKGESPRERRCLGLCFRKVMGYGWFKRVVKEDFLGSSDGKESACSAGDSDSIPGSENPLEEEMAAHSSTLAWEIPWTEEPGRLQSRGSQQLDTA